MGQQFFMFFQYLACLLRALLLSCFALNLLLFHQNAFFTFILGHAFLRFCLLCFKVVSDGEHPCTEHGARSGWVLLRML